MPRTHRPYPPEFRAQILELVRLGRTPNGAFLLLSRLYTQIKDIDVNIIAAFNETERKYLTNYLAQEGDFKVYWGSTLEFVRQLHQGWSQ